MKLLRVVLTAAMVMSSATMVQAMAPAPVAKSAREHCAGQIVAMATEWDISTSVPAVKALILYLRNVAKTVELYVGMCALESPDGIPEEVATALMALGEKSRLAIESHRPCAIPDHEPFLIGASANGYDIFDVCSAAGAGSLLAQLYALPVSPLKKQLTGIWLAQLSARFASDTYSLYFPQIKTALALNSLRLIAEGGELETWIPFIVAIEAYLTTQGILKDNVLEDGRRASSEVSFPSGATVVSPASYQSACDRSAWQPYYDAARVIARDALDEVQAQRALAVAAKAEALAARRAAARPGISKK